MNEKIINFIKNKKVYIAMLMLGLVLGFGLGMEYQSYKVRKSISEAFGESFKYFTEDSEIEEAEKDNKELAKRVEAENLREQVDMELLNKTFREAGEWEFESFIVLKVEFTNKTDRNINGVQGNIEFYDIFDDKIFSSDLSYDQGIEPNSSKVWEAGLSYNEFIDSHKKLKNTDIENLKFRWVPKKIIYKDVE